MESVIRSWRRLFLAALLAADIAAWQAVWQRHSGSGLLTVAFLDIGQGDSIYIESPAGNQVVVDGGPDSATVRALGAVMPFYDHSLDMIAVTNPDKDHFAGFLEVLDRYSVGAELEPGTVSKTPIYRLLEKKMADQRIPRVIARRGQSYDLGGGAMLYVLFPDRDVSDWSSNEGSLVMKLEYGKTSVYLAGDSIQNIERYLVTIDGAALGEAARGGETILKAGHHGSRTSTSPELVAALRPKYAAISAGLDNKFGHPHKETLDALADYGVQPLVTFKEGTIIFESDGEHFTRKRQLAR